MESTTPTSVSTSMSAEEISSSGLGFDGGEFPLYGASETQFQRNSPPELPTAGSPPVSVHRVGLMTERPTFADEAPAPSTPLPIGRGPELEFSPTAQITSGINADGLLEDAELTRFGQTKRGHELAGDASDGEFEEVDEFDGHHPHHDGMQRAAGAHVVMCVAVGRNRLGIAVFREDSNELEAAETFESTNFDMFQLIVGQVQPDVIVTHTVNSDKFTQALRSIESDGSQPEVKYQRMVDFSVDSARSKFAMVSVSSGQDISKVLDNAVDEHTQQIRALCGIVTFLLKLQPATGDGVEDKLHISRITTLGVESVMQLDANTIHALQVFKSEEHPSVLSQGNSKEGMSLFCILSRWCSSPPGRAMMRQWLTRPLLDVTLIEERLDAVSFLVSTEASEPFIEALRAELKSLRNLSKAVQRIEQVTASLQDWKNLFTTTMKARRLGEVLMSRGSESTLPVLLERIVRACADPKIFDVASTIDQVIDLKESGRARRLCVKPGISDDLDELKHMYDALPDFLTHVAKAEMADIKLAFSHHLHVVYLPQIGCLVALPVDNVVNSSTQERLLDEDETPVFKDVHQPIPGGTPFDASKPTALQYSASVVQVAVDAIEGLEYQFHTSTQVYCKSPRMRDLDERLGDIHNDIVDYEAHLTRQVADRVLESADELTMLSAATSQLDVFVGFAAAAIELNYNRPRVVDVKVADSADSNILYIENGRHPIQELCLENTENTVEFIANDTAIANSREGSVQLITGPNYSGKSVYLKQVG
jgi:DNA mismatch repair protein MSH5